MSGIGLEKHISLLKSTKLCEKFLIITLNYLLSKLDFFEKKKGGERLWAKETMPCSEAT